MTGYTRRYLTPQPNALTGTTEELPYDVITELSYDNETTFQRTLAYLSKSAMPEEITEDESASSTAPNSEWPQSSNTALSCSCSRSCACSRRRAKRVR
jgi:hypothetical protein